MEYKLIEILEEYNDLPTKIKITMCDGSTFVYIATNENKSSKLTNECFKKLVLLYEQEKEIYKSTMDFIENNPKIIKNVPSTLKKASHDENKILLKNNVNKTSKTIKITSLSLAGILAVVGIGYTVNSLIKNNRNDISLAPTIITTTPTKIPNYNTTRPLPTSTVIPKITNEPKLQNSIVTKDMKTQVTPSIQNQNNGYESLIQTTSEINIKEPLLTTVPNPNVTKKPISQIPIVTQDIKVQVTPNNQEQINKIETVSNTEINSIGKTIIKSQIKSIKLNGQTYNYRVTTYLPIFDNEVESMEIPYVMILPGTGECSYAINGKNNRGIDVWNSVFEVSEPSLFSSCNSINEYGTSYPCIIEMIEMLPPNINLNNGGIEFDDQNCGHIIYYLENLNNQIFTNGIGQSFTINPNINIAGHSSGSKCIGDLIEYIARQNLNNKNFNFNINKIVLSGGGQYGKIFTTCDNRVIKSASDIFKNKIIPIIGNNDEYNLKNKGKHAKIYDFLYCNSMLDENTLNEYLNERYYEFSINNINLECQKNMQKYSTSGEYILSLPINHDEGSNENALCILKIVEKQYQKSLNKVLKK